MASLENNVKNMTGIIQQLLGLETSNYQAHTWGAYGNLLNSSNDDGIVSEGNEIHNNHGLNFSGLKNINGMSVNDLSNRDVNGSGIINSNVRPHINDGSDNNEA
ncbi:unnamed protein product [Cochlearia groenlandica]